MFQKNSRKMGIGSHSQYKARNDENALKSFQVFEQFEIVTQIELFKVRDGLK